MISNKKAIHGHETEVVYYGPDFVVKRPLSTYKPEQRESWLEKQHRTKDAIDAIRAVGRNVYNIPEMKFINDDECQILEERAPGERLTYSLFVGLSKRQQNEIVNSIGAFLVDMNELKPVLEEKNHRIISEFDFESVVKFVDTRMEIWFTKNEVLQMKRFCDALRTFAFDTVVVWSHGDLNPGNVYYDIDTSKLSFIDFAESGYHVLYRDIFAPLQTNLHIEKRVYEKYLEYHQPKLWRMMSFRNEKLQQIMACRLYSIFLKRFLRESMRLHADPQTDNSKRKVETHVAFMREQMTKISLLEQQISRHK